MGELLAEVHSVPNSDVGVPPFAVELSAQVPPREDSDEHLRYSIRINHHKRYQAGSGRSWKEIQDVIERERLKVNGAVSEVIETLRGKNEPAVDLALIRLQDELTTAANAVTEAVLDRTARDVLAGVLPSAKALAIIDSELAIIPWEWIAITPRPGEVVRPHLVTRLTCDRTGLQAGWDRDWDRVVYSRKLAGLRGDRFQNESVGSELSNGVRCGRRVLRFEVPTSVSNVSDLTGRSEAVIVVAHGIREPPALDFGSVSRPIVYAERDAMTWKFPRGSLVLLLACESGGGAMGRAIATASDCTVIASLVELPEARVLELLRAFVAGFPSRRGESVRLWELLGNWRKRTAPLSLLFAVDGVWDVSIAHS